MLTSLLTLLCAAAPLLGDPACPGFGRLAATSAEFLDFYGESVAVSGGWAVGLSRNADHWPAEERGRLDLWRDGPDGWTLHDQLQPFELPDMQSFSGALDADGGDRIAFGAFDPTGPGAGFRRVVVLQRTGNTWAVDEVLSSGVEAVPGFPGDGFGLSVALHGDRLAVGAPYATVTEDQQGLVHTFRRDPGGWVSTGVLAAPTAVAIDRFGQAVALSDTHLVVTGPSPGVGQPGGDVHLFERVGETWVHRHTTNPQGPPAGQGIFGERVVFSPPTVAVSHTETTGQGSGASGQVHVYRLVANQLLDDQLIDGWQEGHSGRTGSGLGLSAGRLVIGSVPNNPFDQGEVYVYERLAAVWTLVETVTPCGSGAPEGFGWALDVDGARLMVGAPSLNRLRPFTHDGLGFVAEGLLPMGAEVSAARGGQVSLLIDDQGTAPGSTYVMLGSVSGTSPGVVLKGVPVPLNFDVWFELLLGLPSGGIFQAFQGSLDVSEPAARLTVPPDLPPTLVGLRFDHAWVEVQGSQVLSASEAEGFLIDL